MLHREARRRSDDGLRPAPPGDPAERLRDVPAAWASQTSRSGTPAGARRRPDSASTALSRMMTANSWPKNLTKRASAAPGAQLPQPFAAELNGHGLVARAPLTTDEPVPPNVLRTLSSADR